MSIVEAEGKKDTVRARRISEFIQDGSLSSFSPHFTDKETEAQSGEMYSENQLILVYHVAYASRFFFPNRCLFSIIMALKEYPICTELFCKLFQEFIDVCIGLFLDSLFCSITFLIQKSCSSDDYTVNHAVREGGSSNFFLFKIVSVLCFHITFRSSL